MSVSTISLERLINVDRLANSSHTQDLEFIIHFVPPMDLVSFVEADYHGVSCNRLCPELVPSF